jgi:hypothetical protein
VGTGTLTFSDADNGSFGYTVNGISQTKAITREVFGPLPSCIFGAQADPALATNYQDLWWNAPGGSESGWGINLAHEGNAIFAIWFTYDHDRTQMWLVVTAARTVAGTYARCIEPRVRRSTCYRSIPQPSLEPWWATRPSLSRMATARPLPIPSTVSHRRRRSPAKSSARRERCANSDYCTASV